MVAESTQSQLKCADGASSQSPSAALEQLTVLLKDGAQVPADAGVLGELPPWFDYVKFRRGQRYFLNNYFALFVSKLSGLLVILAVPSILRVLILTKQSSKAPSAFRRYLSTITHMLDWYDGDLLEPSSRAHKSLREVRGRHCSAARKAVRAGLGTITQLDMALTQFGFMGFGLLVPEKLGLAGTPEDQEGFVHFWRTVGHLLGIQDRFNICRENVMETRALCEAVLQQVLAPALQSPSPYFAEMARALLQGMWAMVPFIDHDAFLSFTYRLAGLEYSVDREGNMRPYCRVLLNFQIFVHEVILNFSLLSWLARRILNFQMWISIFISQRYPYLAYMTFGKAQLI